MKHEENQLDIFRDDPAVQARAHRIAAQTDLSQGDNQFFTAQERFDKYTAEAIRLEGLAKECHPGATA